MSGVLLPHLFYGMIAHSNRHTVNNRDTDKSPLPDELSRTPK